MCKSQKTFFLYNTAMHALVILKLICEVGLNGLIVCNWRSDLENLGFNELSLDFYIFLKSKFTKKSLGVSF